MRLTRTFAVPALVLILAACATAPSKPVTNEFEDISVPKGMALLPERSTLIESPTVKAGRLIYRGRLEPESLGRAMRATLEAGGWKLVTASTSQRGVNQVYEKTGDSLQVLIWEGMYYTYLEIERTQSRATPPARQ